MRQCEFNFSSNVCTPDKTRKIQLYFLFYLFPWAIDFFNHCSSPMKVILFSIPEYCNLRKSNIILLAMLYAVYKNHYYNINIREIEEEETFYL